MKLVVLSAARSKTCTCKRNRDPKDDIPLQWHNAPSKHGSVNIIIIMFSSCEANSGDLQKSDYPLASFHSFITFTHSFIHLTLKRELAGIECIVLDFKCQLKSAEGHFKSYLYVASESQVKFSSNIFMFWVYVWRHQLCRRKGGNLNGAPWLPFLLVLHMHI